MNVQSRFLSFGRSKLPVVLFGWILSLSACNQGDSGHAARSSVNPSVSTSSNAISGTALTSLFDLTRQDQAGKKLDLGFYEDLFDGFREDPNWPALAYLLGEVYRESGDYDSARQAFREVAAWAVSGPAGLYEDTWGGSGLAVIALWRWLEFMDEFGNTTEEEVGQALEIGSTLQQSRFYSGMTRSKGGMPALPFVDENLRRRLAHIAWKNHREESASLFLDFLAIDSRDEPDEMDQRIIDAILSQGLASPERLDLFQARRVLALFKPGTQVEQALDTLKRLWEDDRLADDVRAEAGYEWANFNRRQEPRQEIVRVLSKVLELAGDELVAEKVLYRRGMVHNRGAGPEKNTEAFRADMFGLLERFPQSQWADNALFALATDALFDVDIENALLYFEKLREFQGSNDFQDSAYFLPAMGLLGRSNDGDLDRADQLLQEYGRLFPEGVFAMRCLFWRARIAEQRDDLDSARNFFQKIIDEIPFDYYALRARMHLQYGAEARSKDIPVRDSSVWRQISASYLNSRGKFVFSGNSAYHERVRIAGSSDLYSKLLELEGGLKQRLDDIPLDELDRLHVLPAMALVLALRQDSLAARDRDPEPENLLGLVGLLGYTTRDWTSAIYLSIYFTGSKYARVKALQNDPGYLAAVYPNASNLRILQDIEAAAWPIGDDAELSKSLMYAVIRNESSFNPKAISSAGALGLFQFLPSTFYGLEKEWDLLATSGTESASEYLLNAGRNIRLWARWTNAEFPVEKRDSVAIMLMKHHAGSGNIKRWENYWEKLAPDAGDTEFRIETARFRATHVFLRSVLRDTMIADAASLFETKTVANPEIR